MTSSGDINTNFFKLLYGSNYSKINRDSSFKEASKDFDFTSIYDELAQNSDDGVVKKNDLIKALQDEIEELGLKTEDFDATDKSKYNTNEDTNISKLVNLFSKFDDDANFSSDDLQYLENMKVSSSGAKITLKDEDGDSIKTISLKRKDNQTISSTTSSKTDNDKTDDKTSSKKKTDKKANENILKLIYGKNYSKVKNKAEIKKFDINDIYKELKKESGSSKIDEEDLVGAITDALYDLEDLDEEANVEEIVSFLSGLDDKDGFSSKDLTSLKNLSTSSSAKSVTLKNGDKFNIDRDSDGQIYAFEENDVNDKPDSNKGNSSITSPSPTPNSPTAPSVPVVPAPPSAGTVVPVTNPDGTTNVQTPSQTPAQGEAPIVTQAPVAEVNGYTTDKINNDKNKLIQYKNTITAAIDKINSGSIKDVTTVSVLGTLTGYTVDMGGGKYVHFDLENGKMKTANYYTIKNQVEKHITNVTFNDEQQIHGMFVDEVSESGKKGGNNFAEMTGIFNKDGNLELIGYDKNENKHSEVVAKFENNNLNSLVQNNDDFAGSPNAKTYSVNENGFALQVQQATVQAQGVQGTQAQTPVQNSNIPQEGLKTSYDKNGISYAQYEKDGKITYLKIQGETKVEITAEEFEKNK